MLPKAILFDLDDTIISFDSHVESAWEKVCKDFIAKNKMFSFEKLINSINESRNWYWSNPKRHRTGRSNLDQTRRDIVISALKKINCLDEKYGIEIADNYSQLIENMICLFPNALGTLQTLVNRRKIRLELLTNGTIKKQKSADLI